LGNPAQEELLVQSVPLDFLLEAPLQLVELLDLEAFPLS
jgi:hypothetical protein